MYNDLGYCDLRVIIYSQYFLGICIVIIAENVIEFRLSECGVLSGDAKGIINNNYITLYLSGEPFCDNIKISSKRMWYCIHGSEYLGKTVRSIQQIIISDEEI